MHQYEVFHFSEISCHGEMLNLLWFPCSRFHYKRGIEKCLKLVCHICWFLLIVKHAVWVLRKTSDSSTRESQSCCARLSGQTDSSLWFLLITHAVKAVVVCQDGCYSTWCCSIFLRGNFDLVKIIYWTFFFRFLLTFKQFDHQKQEKNDLA